MLLALSERVQEDGVDMGLLVSDLISIFHVQYDLLTLLFPGITIFVGTAMAATAVMSVVSSVIRQRIMNRQT